MEREYVKESQRAMQFFFARVRRAGVVSLPHMRPYPSAQVDAPRPPRNRGQAGVRTVLVAALCLALGLVLGGFWGSRRARPSAANTAVTAAQQEVETPSAGPDPRSVSPAALAPAPAGAATVDPAILAEVKRQLPNFASVSLEEGTRRLRETAVNDFKAAMGEMQRGLEEAQQRVARASEGTAGAEREAALRELQRLQSEQAAKLREITTRSSAQIEALRQLKQSGR